ncbi:hypothetical protein NB311A_19592 [Nitrobacter sp. Nb-311A]|nr:hypothetical protein NB311A_19592 [Nitrobacter sp. Nb-311A]
MAELPKKVQIGWQVFRRREATSEYITRSGMCIDLVRFDALCATCGAPFAAKVTKTGWRRKILSRRCEPHRRPGAYVNNDKPPIPIAEMPWWAKPAPWSKSRPGKVHKPPRKPVEPRRRLQRPQQPVKAPAQPSRPSFLD